MEITRTSALTGITRTRELPVTQAQLEALAIHGAAYSHAILNGLSDEDIEFVVLGSIPDEWAEATAAA